MKKVKVTKGQADTIEALRGVISDEALIRLLSANDPGASELFMPGDKATKAVLVGYEVERIPPDIVNERIAEIRATVVTCSDHERILDAEMAGIKLVVDAYGFRGINV